jgi:hypothetical protein
MFFQHLGDFGGLGCIAGAVLDIIRRAAVGAGRIAATSSTRRTISGDPGSAA